MLRGLFKRNLEFLHRSQGRGINPRKDTTERLGHENFGVRRARVVKLWVWIPHTVPMTVNAYLAQSRKVGGPLLKRLPTTTRDDLKYG